MKRNGFVSTTILYSFLLIFIALFGILVSNQVSMRSILAKYNNSIRGKLNNEEYISFDTNASEYVLKNILKREDLGIKNDKDIADFYIPDGLYSDYDDYGITYYYNNKIEDNYLLFAGYMWKIIRINGNGSLRIIYQDIDYKKVAFGNTSSKAEFLAVLGKNTISSNAKLRLEEFYEKIIIMNKLNSYIEDAIFCQDNLFFDRTTQVVDGPGSKSFSCSLENIYTVSNGRLKYPIGLITRDEVLYSGVNNSYFGSAEPFWTMTRAEEELYVYDETSEYNLSSALYSNPEIILYPVINLKFNYVKTIKNGDGTLDNPYRSKYEK